MIEDVGDGTIRNIHRAASKLFRSGPNAAKTPQCRGLAYAGSFPPGYNHEPSRHALGRRRDGRRYGDKRQRSSAQCRCSQAHSVLSTLFSWQRVAFLVFSMYQLNLTKIDKL